MKNLLLIAMILTGLNSFIIAQTHTIDYLGQTPPGDTPVVFAPGLVSDSTLGHSATFFSPDGNEVYWCSRENQDSQLFIYRMRRINNRWTMPEVFSPLGDTVHYCDPHITPDGKRILFSSNAYNKFKVWSQEITENGEGEVHNISDDIGVNYMHLQSTITNSGTLYFLAVGWNDNESSLDILRSQFKDGTYQEPELLPTTINSDSMDWNPFIAPDESYLIFASKRLRGQLDLYISFRDKATDTWSEAINMGEKINTDVQEGFPTVSPDGKYLFFTRYNQKMSMDVFWVSAGIIEKLKEKSMPQQHLKQQNKNEEIHEAVDAGDMNKVQALIEGDLTLLEAKDENGATPLIRACINRYTMQRQPEIAKFLIEKGANVNAVDSFNITPLIGACVGYGPDYELIKYFIAKGAEVNVMGTNGITPIHWAAFYGDLKVAKLLIDNGADVNFYDTYEGVVAASSISGTVLQVAINSSSASEELVKLIIESGAKLNRTDSQGNTELHLAALKGNADLVQLMIEHGADVDAVNEYNRTALYYAAKHGYRNVADMLIAAGAKKSTIAETNYGKAPQLKETLKDGEAYIWSLGGSAYAVKTKNNLIVFTGGNRIDESQEAGLANGHLNPNELAGQKITIFVNHMDRWQMGAKDFARLAKFVSDINLVSSFNPDFSKEENSDIPAYRLAAPNESFSVGGIQVHTIPALAGGLGYLIEVDGVKVFNAGLHISGKEASEVEAYRKEIDFLKPFGPIDIVMLTVHSHSNRVGMDHVNHLYLFDQLEPKAIYMFGANIPETYTECADVLQVRNIPMMYPEVKQANGERYHYLRDRTKK